MKGGVLLFGSCCCVVGVLRVLRVFLGIERVGKLACVFCFVTTLVRTTLKCSLADGEKVTR